MTKVYDLYLQPIGITVTQYTLLLAVQRLGPVTITTLADEVILERTTCTRNLKVLERKELIHLQPGQDKRMKQVVLTALGAEKITDAQPLWKEAQHVIFKEIGEDSFLTLLSELPKMIGQLKSL